MTISDTAFRQYVETALWASTDDDSEPLDDNYGYDDIDPDSLASMRQDLDDFFRANREDIDRYCDGLGLDDTNAAHDFWLTRNHHGAGFWDRYYGSDNAIYAVCKRLTDSAHAYGESDLYAGDDGTLYISPGPGVWSREPAVCGGTGFHPGQRNDDGSPVTGCDECRKDHHA